ncbi:MAG: hypothetical protein FJW20_02825 [Acidimicrobiia bacterium]|nr:hypothetical protein [Acidimicrobiia bacterium]
MRFLTCLLITASAYATITVTPTQMTFVQGVGGQIPPAQTISVTSTSGPINAPVGGGAGWLGFTFSSLLTPSIITVTANPVGLNPGTYNSTITISSNTAPNSPIVVSVTLIVNTASSPTVNPTVLTFTHTQLQPAPPAQLINVNAPVGSFTVVSSESWLITSAPTATNPSQISVTVNAAGFATGNYSAVITITFSTTPTVFQLVAVTLTVGPGASPWTVTGTPLTFPHRFGDPAPIPQRFNVDFTSVVPFTVTVTSVGGWLTVDPESAVTPAAIFATVNPQGLLAGTYTGTITLATVGADPFVLTVTLIITGAPALSSTANVLDFTAPSGGQPPAARTVVISSTPLVGISVQILNGPWLTVSPLTGTTPQTLTFTPSPLNLAPGVYRASVIITAAGSNTGGQLVTVNFTVTPSAPLTVSPSSFRFEGAAGGPAPPIQTLNVTSNAGISIAIAASPGWLVVTPTTAVTPAIFSVSVITAGLAPGIYNGRITVSAPGSTLALQTIEVVLNVGSAAPTITELSNAAGLNRDFAPGSVLIIYGRDLGPAIPRSATAVPGGILATTLADVQVLLNGIASPLLYVSGNQINLIIPFELDGQTSMQIRVIYQGVPSQTLTVPLAPTAPVIFTADGSGRNQAAVLNQNNTTNTPTTPAARGSVIVVYAAGGGVHNPALATGSVTERAGPPPRAEATLFIGGLQAVLIYAGPAPGSAAGILQFNGFVPELVTPGPNVSIVLRIGAAFSPTGATIAVQ